MFSSPKQSTTHGLISHCVPLLINSRSHSTNDIWQWTVGTRVLLLFALVVLGFPTILEKGWLRHFPVCSIRFLTKRSLKSWWEYWVPCTDQNLFCFTSSSKWEEVLLSTWRYFSSLNSCWLLDPFHQHTPDVSCSVLQYMVLRCFSFNH